MQIVHSLPKIMLRHKVINFLCSIGLQERSSEITFNNNAKIVIDLSDPEPRNVFIKKSFEPNFFEVANAFISDDGIFFDLGANVGFCTFGLVPKKNNVSYHLFEANFELIPYLKHSVRLHKDCLFKINHSCITDKVGVTKFHLTNKQTGQSHVAVNNEDGYEIRNEVLDIYCKENEINFIDFAKIDLEGNELPALRGWESALIGHSILAIYIEIIPENQIRYKFSPNEVLLYLESFGYELFLCKEEDFGKFGKAPVNKIFKNSKLTVSSFSAKEYPNNFATDVLAVASKTLNA